MGCNRLCTREDKEAAQRAEKDHISISEARDRIYRERHKMYADIAASMAGARPGESMADVARRHFEEAHRAQQGGYAVQQQQSAYQSASSPFNQTPQPTYEAPPPSYQSPQPTYEAPPPSYQSPQPTYQAPPPSYPSPQSTYQAPPPSYPSPQPTHQAPPPSYQTPQPTYQAHSSQVPEAAHNLNASHLNRGVHGEYVSTFDTSGRVTSAQGWLTLSHGQSPSTKGTVGMDRGHLIGKQFGGSGDRTNIINMDPRINRSFIREYEAAVADHVRNGAELYLVVRVTYGATDSAMAIHYDLYQKGSVIPATMTIDPQTSREFTLKQGVAGSGWSVREFVDPLRRPNDDKPMQ